MLSPEDKENFPRIINLLLAETFVLREVLEPKKQTLRVNPDFRFLERNLDLCREYLFMAGWELDLDLDYGVAAVFNRYGYNKLRLDRFTTLFVYGLRLIYEEEREKLALGKTVITTLPDLLQKLSYLGVWDRKVSESFLQETLGVLREFNLIERLENTWLDPNGRILIYPSILQVVSNERVHYWYEKLSLEEGAETLEKPDQTAVD